MTHTCGFMNLCDAIWWLLYHGLASWSCCQLLIAVIKRDAPWLHHLWLVNDACVFPCSYIFLSLTRSHQKCFIPSFRIDHFFPNSSEPFFSKSCFWSVSKTSSVSSTIKKAPFYVAPLFLFLFFLLSSFFRILSLFSWFHASFFASFHSASCMNACACVVCV